MVTVILALGRRIIYHIIHITRAMRQEISMRQKRGDRKEKTEERGQKRGKRREGTEKRKKKRDDRKEEKEER